MAYTFQELKKKNVGELKEIAKEMEHEAVKGYTQMNKDHLLHAICTALGLEEHVHHEVKGMDKAKIKGNRILRDWNARDASLDIESEIREQIKESEIREQINTLGTKQLREKLELWLQAINPTD